MLRILTRKVLRLLQKNHVPTSLYARLMLVIGSRHLTEFYRPHLIQTLGFCVSPLFPSNITCFTPATNQTEHLDTSVFIEARMSLIWKDVNENGKPYDLKICSRILFNRGPGLLPYDLKICSCILFNRGKVWVEIFIYIDFV